MGILREKLCSGETVITAEVAPPKGPGTKRLIRQAELLRSFTDAVNVTDCQRALVKMSSLAASRLLLDIGIEPVFQLTCRDRNTIALQSDLMGAGALGIENLLCLTGDPVKVGDNPTAKPVFEVEAIKELELVAKLQKGFDSAGNKMNRRTQFFTGAVVNPTLRHGTSQLARMEKKVNAGASFFQTQANYDLEDFQNFLLEAKKLDTHVLAGILVLHSKDIAGYIRDKLPGVRMPDQVYARFQDGIDEESVGIDIAVDTMVGLQGQCSGFHLMSVKYEEILPRVMEKYHERLEKNPSLSLSSATAQ